MEWAREALVVADGTTVRARHGAGGVIGLPAASPGSFRGLLFFFSPVDSGVLMLIDRFGGLVG